MTDQTDSSARIAVSPEQIKQFCQRHRIRRLALSGSILTEDFNDESDVDVLVEFIEGHTPDFFRLFYIEEELSGLFGGRPIDLVTYRALNRHLRASVLAEAQVQFSD